MHATRWLALAAAAAVMITGADQVPAQAAQSAPFPPLTVQTEHVVPATRGTFVPYASDPAAARALRGAPAAPVWPAAGSAVVSLAAPTAGRAVAATPVRAGSLPVTLSADAASPSKVSIQVLDRARTAAVRPDAVVMRVARADGLAGAAPVKVSVDYTRFRSAFGGDWANRLHLEQLPECALTTPAAAGCQGTALSSRNTGGAVTAAVTASAGSGTLVALTSGSSGGTGSFTATSLAASGAWEAGGPSGDFSWSYGLRVPPALGGPEPQLTLAYSAQSVDGRMASSNNQPSWIGQGFEMWSGYVERSYKSCSDDMGGSANNTTKTGDECWGTDNATMSLGGKTVELVKDDATGAWHPKADDGSRIEHLTGASNGANGGEYWRVTTANGTQYYFGLNHLPGWTSGRPETNSTWTVPVFGNNPGEPCYQPTFDASWCAQAWRWNLDYVVDPHGNSMSYWYATETNNYARNLTSSEVSSYVRGGYLTEIDYGTRTAAEFGTAPQRVLFTVADRCIPGTTCDTAHPASWPDVPWDRSCTSSTSCTDYSPTFFSQKRLASVKTQVWGGSAYRDVEQWTLSQTYPDPGDGTMAGLWLAGISHSGLVGGTASVPDVTFTGVQMPNRVDSVGDNLPAMNWWRVAAIHTETGGEIDVQYSGQDCIPGSRMPSAPESNTLRCYPVIWTPAGDTSPITDYFNKYVVTAVIETDHTGGAPRTINSYTYIGTPSWHYTDNDGLVPASTKTWSEWRGYQKVGVTKGDPGDQLSTTSPTAITTSTLGPNGSYVTTYALYDGLLRPRQTQAPAVGTTGNVLVTDTLYDTAGRAYKSNATYVVNGTPGTTLVVPSGDNQIAAQTVTLFDGADRPTASIFDSFGVEQWRTTTAYGGDHTDVTPPPGGFATSTITDARGRKVELRQYHGGTPTGAYDSTTYAYTAKDQPATVTDAAGNTWTYGYDVQGRQTSVTSPDTGTTTSTYDDAGHLLTTTDGRGQTLAYTYDVLGRKTGEFSGSTSGTQLASWTYDTLARGQSTSSTRFVNGSAYVSAVTGYDSQYRPTGTRVTIPAAEGALAGTYQFSTTYKPDGSVSTMTAAGGLPQEVLSYSYTDLGQPSTLSGTQSYVTQAQYTQLGEPAVYTLSTGAAIAQVGYFYDEATRRLTELMDVRQTAPSTIADQQRDCANRPARCQHRRPTRGPVRTASEHRDAGERPHRQQLPLQHRSLDHQAGRHAVIDRPPRIRGRWDRSWGTELSAPPDDLRWLAGQVRGAREPVALALADVPSEAIPPYEGALRRLVVRPESGRKLRIAPAAGDLELVGETSSLEILADSLDSLPAIPSPSGATCTSSRTRATSTWPRTALP